jgi:hypothetical protein
METRGGDCIELYRRLDLLFDHPDLCIRVQATRWRWGDPQPEGLFLSVATSEYPRRDTRLGPEAPADHLSERARH